MDELLIQVGQIATRNYGGHYCIFKFTTNWRGLFRTPMDDLHDIFDKQQPYKTLEGLLNAMIKNPKDFEAY